jgi:hypothetical protein
VTGLPYNDYNGYPFLTWEKISRQLDGSNIYYEMVFEQIIIADNVVDTHQLGLSLSYAYYSLAIQFQGIKLFPKRFGRERDGAIQPYEVFNLATATLLGLEQQTTHLFTLVKHCYPYGGINALFSYFNDFIILLAGAVRGYNISARTNRKEPFPYQAIIDHWDSTDDSVIEKALLHLCDEQVKQVASPPSADYFEFHTLNWQFYPYAALMLMKVRLNKGLTNPSVSHPAFGELNVLLPEELNELPIDDTLSAVIKRMKSQGFDEDDVFRLDNIPG